MRVKWSEPMRKKRWQLALLLVGVSAICLAIPMISGGPSRELRLWISLGTGILLATVWWLLAKRYFKLQPMAMMAPTMILWAAGGKNLAEITATGGSQTIAVTYVMFFIVFPLFMWLLLQVDVAALGSQDKPS